MARALGLAREQRYLAYKINYYTIKNVQLKDSNSVVENAHFRGNFALKNWYFEVRISNMNFEKKFHGKKSKFPVD